MAPVVRRVVMSAAFERIRLQLSADIAARNAAAAGGCDSGRVVASTAAERSPPLAAADAFQGQSGASVDFIGRLNGLQQDASMGEEWQPARELSFSCAMDVSTELPSAVLPATAGVACVSAAPAPQPPSAKVKGMPVSPYRGARHQPMSNSGGSPSSGVAAATSATTSLQNLHRLKMRGALSASQAACLAERMSQGDAELSAGVDAVISGRASVDTLFPFLQRAGQAEPGADVQDDAALVRSVSVDSTDSLEALQQSGSRAASLTQQLPFVSPQAQPSASKGGRTAPTPDEGFLLAVIERMQSRGHVNSTGARALRQLVACHDPRVEDIVDTFTDELGAGVLPGSPQANAAVGAVARRLLGLLPDIEHTEVDASDGVTPNAVSSGAAASESLGERRAAGQPPADATQASVGCTPEVDAETSCECSNTEVVGKHNAHTTAASTVATEQRNASIVMHALIELISQLAGGDMFPTDPELGIPQASSTTAMPAAATGALAAVADGDETLNTAMRLFMHGLLPFEELARAVITIGVYTALSSGVASAEADLAAMDAEDAALTSVDAMAAPSAVADAPASNQKPAHAECTPDSVVDTTAGLARAHTELLAALVTHQFFSSEEANMLVRCVQRASL
ncbi:MAG: hypothetical protein EOO41_00585 [Methanobacteriota archaeon]|nr:MAG: hypothetical protein EOO41_00585 [Euryarchaeota archaeon]